MAISLLLDYSVEQYIPEDTLLWERFLTMTIVLCACINIFICLQNEIKEIEGLDTLTSLKFLTLSHNQITRVQNLKNTRLGFLDLSYNSIEHLAVGKYL